MEIHHRPGQPVLSHPHSEKCFLTFRGNLPCFSLCPWPLVLSQSPAEKSLALSSWRPPFGYLHTWMRSLLSLLFSGVKTSFSVLLCVHSLQRRAFKSVRKEALGLRVVCGSQIAASAGLESRRSSVSNSALGLQCVRITGSRLQIVPP